MSQKKEKNDRQVKVLLSEFHHQILTRKAENAGLKLAPFLRDVLTAEASSSTNKTLRSFPSVHPELVRLIAHVDRNLEVIASRIGDTDFKSSLNLLGKLIEIERRLMEIQNAHKISPTR